MNKGNAMCAMCVRDKKMQLCLLTTSPLPLSLGRGGGLVLYAKALALKHA